MTDPRMTHDDFARWQEHNRDYLVLCIDELFERMRGEDTEHIRRRLASLDEQLTLPPTLAIVVEVFALGDFERDLVLLCFAGEVDPRFRTDPRQITLGYALEALATAHWRALDAAEPLRRWGIVNVDEDALLADAPLRLASDVVRFLMGFDPRIGGDPAFIVDPGPEAVVARQAEQAAQLARAVETMTAVLGRAPAVELHGATEEDRIALAGICAQHMHLALATVPARDLPAPGRSLDELLRTWDRRARLTGTLLCITGADDHEGEPAIDQRVSRALARLQEPFLMTVAQPTTFGDARPVIRRAVEPLTADERLEVWRACLRTGRERTPGAYADVEDGDLAALAVDFRLGARTIARVWLEREAQLLGDDDSSPPAVLEPELRAGCARAVRARLDPVAERVRLEGVADVVLPEREAEQLVEFEQRVRLSTHVATSWGVGGGREGGLTALFAGPSGTGKTHAALAVARRLGYDLYRVNVAAVLSKYIGETEKNLDRIFQAAEIGGVILLFDEADALFGKRSEVRDSHDRYANLGTAYLLARLESTPVPTILTTNIKDAIDPAFTRRLSFIVDFPFPAQGDREQIWRTIYPQQTPVFELEHDRLATVAVSGGAISNIARRGAFLAAAEPSAIEMRHLLDGTRRELRKAGRDLSPEERTAWIRST